MVSENVLDMGFLDGSKIRMKNPDNVRQILNNMASAGPESLQVILDFDNTMTRVHESGVPCACSWQVLENDEIMPQFYKDETDKLKAKYFPMEIDPHMPIEEKIPMAVEWFTKAHDVLIKTGLKKSSISEMVKRSTLKFRDGMSEMLRDLDALDVPLLIFSAGLGDLIMAVLERHSRIYKNIKVVSNFMKFDADGTMIGFHDQLIHMYNKNERALNSCSYWEDLQHHSNVLLMGDNVGDIQMSDGLSNITNIVKVGFLNHYSEDRLRKHMDCFDIVVIDDQTMDIGNNILKLIRSSCE